MLKRRKIIKRLIRVFDTPWAGKWIPYRIGSKILGRISSSPYARNNLYKRKAMHFNSFLEVLELESSDKLIRQKFMCDFKKNWRCMSVSHMNRKKIDKYIHFEGLETFQQKYSEGKGVILLGSHIGVAALSISLFPKLGYSDFYTIVRDDGAETSKFKDINPKMEINTLKFSKRSNAELMKSLFKAKQVLDDGGIIHTMGDGQKGNSTFATRFIKKMRAFRVSFAELGISTEAYILPIIIMLDENGHFRVRIYEPLDKGDESMDREARTKHLTSQYSEILGDAWLKNPDQVNQGHIESYLSFVNVFDEPVIKD